MWSCPRSVAVWGCVGLCGAVLRAGTHAVWLPSPGQGAQRSSTGHVASAVGGVEGRPPRSRPRPGPLPDGARIAWVLLSRGWARAEPGG